MHIFVAMMQALKWLLFPLSIIWYLVAVTKRALYHSGVFTRYESKLPSIVVGNLSMGGTGKTPISGHIIDMLSKRGLRVAYLSRGYGRRSKGLKEVLVSSSSEEVGDEALMIKRRHPSISVWVCENRVVGMKHLENQDQLQVVVLDDAFQHLRFKAGFYLMLSTAQNPFFKDSLFPLGTLREPRWASRYANAVLFTKCPPPSDPFWPRLNAQAEMMRQAVFFSGITYSYELREVFGEGSMPIDSAKPVFAFSAIARNQDFFQAVQDRFQLVDRRGFRDHYNYSAQDLKELQSRFEELKKQHSDLIILTTEKDAARLRTLDGAREFLQLTLFSWSIEPKFLMNGQDRFDQLILDYVERNKRSS